MGQTMAIEVSGLKKSYGDHVAVKQVSFSVQAGEVFVLAGPNGAGKTTTVECMEGLRNPDGGTIRIWGMDPRRDREKLFRFVGVQLQENTLHPRLKVKEALEVFSLFMNLPCPREKSWKSADWRDGKTIFTGNCPVDKNVACCWPWL